MLALQLAPGDDGLLPNARRRRARGRRRGRLAEEHLRLPPAHNRVERGRPLDAALGARRR